MLANLLRRSFSAATATNLTGKTALVTGSTSGIGLGIARELARHGAGIIINGFGKMEDIQAIRADITKEFGVETWFAEGDMSVPASVQAMMKAAPTVDILVNNAGVQHVESVATFPAANWDKIISINLSSALYTTQAVLPRMREKGWGRVINIASVHGFFPSLSIKAISVLGESAYFSLARLVASLDKSAYVASKHGLVGFTKVLALETAGQGQSATEKERKERRKKEKVRQNLC